MDVRGAGVKGGFAGQEDSAARGHPESGCVNCITPGPQRSPEPGSGSHMGFIPWPLYLSVSSDCSTYPLLDLPPCFHRFRTSWLLLPALRPSCPQTFL